MNFHLTESQMKKQLASLLAALCITTMASAPALADMNISTDGSTSMEKVIGSLGEAFSELHDGVNFTYNPTGSGAGINAALEGRCDIGLSSRALKADEVTKLNGTTLCIDGIVVVVNPQNPVKDLSVDQIAQIFKGEITNWKDIGGNDGPIVLIGREAGSGTRDGFETVTGTSELCKYRQELTSTGDVITTVSQNANAIGYASLAAVSDKIHVVTVDGVAATKETIQDGSYKLQRPFVLVTRKDQPLTQDAQTFFDYAMSEEAKPIIEMAGAIPNK